LTTSTDDYGGGSQRAIELSTEDYSVIFQVTKELPNLPAERLARLGVSSDSAGEVVRTARTIRDAGRLSSRIAVEIHEDVAVEAPAVDEGASQTLKTVVDRRLFADWCALLRDIISWLDNRELFLRTGYGLDEVAPVVSRFVGSD
jgi:hypothetical protein